MNSVPMDTFYTAASRWIELTVAKGYAADWCVLSRIQDRVKREVPVKKNNKLLMLLVPGFVLVVFFLIVPILRIVLPTFAPDGTFTLQLYKDFIIDPFYQSIFIRTIRISLITCLICVVGALPVSFFISRLKSGRKGILIALATFPLLTNTVVRAFAWITILGREGILNNFFINIGITQEPFKMLYTEGAIVVGSVYLFLPIMITSLVGVMENIGDDVQEAALSLGANRMVTFARVVIPLSMPGIIVGSVLVFAGTASAYSTPLMLGGNRNMMMSTLIYQQAMLLDNWNTASVVAVFMMLTSFIVVGILNRIARKLNKIEA